MEYNNNIPTGYGIQKSISSYVLFVNRKLCSTIRDGFSVEGLKETLFCEPNHKLKIVNSFGKNRLRFKVWKERME